MSITTREVQPKAFDRLPKWAQSEIEQMERTIAEHERTIAEMRADLPDKEVIAVRLHGWRHEDSVPVGWESYNDHSDTIRFRVLTAQERFPDMDLPGEVDICRLGERILEIRSNGGTLRVTHNASNVFHLEVMD